MNSVEPSGLLYQRLLSLDPDSASKIMGFVLIHGPSDADMMALATAPDVVLHQLICRGKSYSRILTAGAASLHSPTYGDDGGSDSTLPDTLSFLGERSKSEELNGLGSESTRMFHKRSFSQSDVFSGGGLRPCNSCNFVHRLGFGYDSCVVDDVAAGLASSPGKVDVFEQELLRARANQQ